MSAETKARLTEVVDRIRSGKPVSMDEFRFHIEHQNLEVKSGPSVGARLPDFKLADQQGRMRGLADLTGPNGLLLVFARTANG
jgi:hypothetical protein